MIGETPAFLLVAAAIMVAGVFVFYRLPRSGQTEGSSSSSPDIGSRDNSVSYEPSLRSSDLLDSARSGGKYLERAIKKNGKFRYQYDPLSNSYIKEYNLLRPSGTIYSLCQLYAVDPRSELVNAAERAIRFLKFYIKPFHNSRAVVWKDKVKLGGNALAILALAEYAEVTGRRQDLPLMKGLAQYIVEDQEPNGGFISTRIYSSGADTGFRSLYYPGEAILALTRLYELDQDERWLEVSERAAQYLIAKRKDHSLNELVHDHWLMIALERLYRHRPNIKYAEEVFRLAEAIILAQRDGVHRRSKRPEWLGSYYTPPRSTPTAIRSEGLVAAYHLAVKLKREDMAEKALRALRLAAGFQLRTQFSRQAAASYSRPDRLTGGFAASLEDPSVRIDYVQHNISAILGLYEILKAQGE